MNFNFQSLKIKTFWLLLLAFVPSSHLNAQELLHLKLDQAIQMAQSNSVAFHRAHTKKENAYWQWKAYRSNLLPQVALNGRLPEYTSAYQPISQPDGSIKYQRTEFNSSTIDLSLSQYLPLTGASLYASSSLVRYDDYANHQRQYSNNPFVVGIVQPILKYNSMKWDRKIEPLKLEESEKEYSQEMEKIAVSTCSYYFDLLLAMQNQAMAKENLANNDTLYSIAVEKSKLGKLSKSDLLQMKLTSINYKKSLAQADIEFTDAMHNFKTFVGMFDTDSIAPEVPFFVFTLNIDKQFALAEALKNRSEATNFKRRQLESEQQVEQAKKNNGLNAELKLEVGYNNADPDLSRLYGRAMDRQIVSFGFKLPIVDWGKAKSQRMLAAANRQLTEVSIHQERDSFEKGIKKHIEQFKILSFNLSMNNEAQTAANERYKIAIERFKMGDISITELNIASNENNQAKQDYISTLKKYWEAYFQIRLLTLYDFVNHQTIRYE